MNKLTAIKIKYQDGTYSEQIPIGASTQNIDWDEDHSLVDILGEVDLSKGNIQTQINSKPDLGETSSMAYRGDRGKTAYNHATDSNRLTTAKSTGLYKVAATSEGHVASLTSVTKSDITNLGIPAEDHITTATTNGSGNAVTSISANNQGALTITKGTTFVTSQDGVSGSSINRFGVCNTGASIAAKTTSITSGTFSLVAGATVAVKFTHTNTVDSPTLNVGNTGAKNIYVNGAQITSGGNKTLLSGTVEFIYDGTHYNLIGAGTSAGAGNVTGVKGDKESSYRTGNINITPSNIGATMAEELTEAEYNALSESEKLADKIFLITDSTEGQLAEEISYDNTDSGLTATNLQDAIDEVDEQIADMVSEQIDSKFGDDIADKVTAWLTKHLTPSGSAMVDLLSFPYQLGVIYSTTADKTTNTIVKIDSADNRVVIGPIKFRKSVQILNGENVQFKLYERYTSDTSSAFRDMYSTWRTSSAIIGVNSWSADNITYYIQIAYTDNRKITDIAALVSDLAVMETESNPLGLIETWGLLSGKAVPNGVGANGSLRFVTDKIAASQQTRIVTINSEYRIAVSKGIDVYTTCSTDALSYGARKLDANYEYALMIQKYPSGTQETLEFKNFQSFNDLYSAIGITVSDMEFNNTYITGNQLTDPTSIISATSYGNTIQQSIFSNGIMLDDGGAILYAHVPSLALADGYAYIAFMANRVEGSEWSVYSEIDLAIVDLSDKSAEYIVIAKSGQYGGITFNGRCSYPAMCFKDNKLYVYFSGTVDDEQKLCCAVYDIELKTFLTSICSIQYNGTTYEFSNSNFTRYIGSIVGLISLGYEIGICNPTTDGTNWYTALASGSAGQMRVPILKSTDMIVWEVFDVLPYECGADCECVIRYSNGILYGASRHPYKDCTTYIFAYDIANKKVVDSMQVPSSASRPTLFENGSSIVMCLPQTGRRTMSLIQLFTSRIKESRLGASMTSYNSLSYNSIASDSSKSYFAIQTYQRSSSSSDVKANPAIFFGNCEKLVF